MKAECAVESFQCRATQMVILNIYFAFIFLIYDLHAVQFTLYNAKFCKCRSTNTVMYLPLQSGPRAVPSPQTFPLTPL